jgi:hypothetical protein
MEMKKRERYSIGESELNNSMMKNGVKCMQCREGYKGGICYAEKN